MNAIIMAGGYGERMRPLTLAIPKPMINLGHHPIIYYTIKHLFRNEIPNITIKTYYKSEIIEDYIKDFPYNINILKTPYQMENISALFEYDWKDEEEGLVIHGDMFCPVKYQSLIDYHRISGKLLTICNRSIKIKEQHSEIITNDKNTIKTFKEKPTVIKRIAVGCYILNKKVMNYANRNDENIATIINKLINDNMVGTYPLGKMTEFYNIGTWEAYHDSNKRWMEKYDKFKQKNI